MRSSEKTAKSSNPNLVVAIFVLFALAAGAIWLGGEALLWANRTTHPDSVISQTSKTTPSPSRATGEQVQPQGLTGPINTQSGGAPAASPQGETPPGMQPTPPGSYEKK